MFLYKLPKTINNINYYGQRLSHFIEEQQYSNYYEVVAERNKAKQSKANTGSRLYKEFLKKSGLSNTTQAKQIFKDIKEFTRLSNLINKHIEELDLTDRKMRELKNMLNKGLNVKNYLDKVPQQMLRYSPLDQIEKLNNFIRPDYVDEILKRKNCTISPKDYRKFISQFNKLNMSQKLKFNNTLYSKYYAEYEYSKAFGEEFNSYEVLKGLLEEVKE